MNTQPTARKNQRWVWYFAVLFILTATALTVWAYFYRKMQLKPEHLEAARHLWKEKGPRDYDMEYTKTVTAPEKFVVRVRDGKVVSVTLNDLPLEDRLHPYHSMPALFSFIDKFLKDDTDPSRPQTFAIASFDPEDGHLIRYIRRVAGTSQQVEIEVKLKPVTTEAPS